MWVGQSFFSIVLLSASALSFSIATTLGQATASSRVAHLTGDITMANGTVKWFNPTKGFGFIQPDNGGPDVFVHISAVERSTLGSLQEGQKLGYELERDQRSGKMSAGQLQSA